MKRTFLGWETPCIPTLVDHLLARYLAEGAEYVDFSNFTLIFSSRFANRLFLKCLADNAYRLGVTIDPPHVRMLGDFPELLYPQKRPFASPLTQQIVWMKAIQKVRRLDQKLVQRVFPILPDETDFLGWMDLGKQLAEIYQELAREAVDFEQVWVFCQDSQKSSPAIRIPDEEFYRWKGLAKIQQEYHRFLDETGEWDRQSARLFALKNFDLTPLPADSRVALVGCVDLNNIQRKFLRHIAAQTEVFIFAPESFAERFDDDGCLADHAWKRLEPALNDKLKSIATQVVSAEDEAQLVASWVLERAAQRAPEEITIGTADESLEPTLFQILRLGGIPTGRALQKELGSTQTWKLLSCFNDCIESAEIPSSFDRRNVEKIAFTPSYETFAALVRHPDFADYLKNACQIEGNWISELDEYYNLYLPEKMPVVDRLAFKMEKSFPALFAVAREVYALMDEALQEFSTFDTLLSIVMRFLRKVYCWRPFYHSDDERENIVVRSCIDINRAFVEYLSLPQSLTHDLRLSLPDAFRLALSRMREKTVSFAPLGDSINFVRWLDLVFDTAPSIILVGLNEGIVPESINEHIFLPNELRRLLKVKTNENRFQRDLYYLSLLLARGCDFKVVFARMSIEETPLLPSRLLLTDESDALAKQAEAYFGDPPEQPTHQPSNPLHAPSGGTPVEFPEVYTIPVPASSMPPRETMSVSEFASYLQNPYLYYLQHVERLAPADDEANELGPAQFGTLAHAVLERFGRHEIARWGDQSSQKLPAFPAEFSTEAWDEETKILEDLLRTYLDEEFARHFDADTQAVVFIQKEQLADRMRFFARQQARRTCEGWRIAAVELSFNDVLLRSEGGRGEPIDFGDNLPMFLRGKIDRIDYHPEKKEWVVWDYKTSEKKIHPEEKHHSKMLRKINAFTPDLWEDLQLPLYRHLILSSRYSSDERLAPARAIDPDQLRFGFISLPKKDDVEFLLASWSPSHFASANEKAEEIARAVRKGDFPFVQKKCFFRTDFDWIINEY
ncbi:MAG: PD-(D/E)XK nuclease family protein [Planctomycetia bacterium]|nr:PD-(D/E)XK nuclease family protein [Planctomycetia bacterium]